MNVRTQIAKILRAIISAILSFFAGMGAYSAVNYLGQGQEPELRPQLNNVEREQKVTPRPSFGHSCPTCGMG